MVSGADVISLQGVFECVLAELSRFHYITPFRWYCGRDEGPGKG